MHRDDVRDALGAMASAVPAPHEDASATIARGRRLVRQRRVALAGVIALLAAIVAAAGAIASNDGDGAPRVASVPTTVDTVGVVPTTTRTTPFRPQPTPIPLAFVSPTEGWICADPMLRTTDAGATWRNVSVPARPTACAAVPGGHVWALVPSSDPRHQALVHVTAGGTTQTFAFPELPNSMLVQELTFVDTRHGFAFAREPARGSAQALLTTKDGGQTWERSDDKSNGRFAFTTATDGWAGMNTAMTSAVLHTTDGGATWQSRGLPAGDGAGGFSSIPVARDGVLVVLVDSEGDLSLAVSRDNGLTWQPQAGPDTLRTGAFGPSMIALTDATHWQVSLGNSLWATDDEGRTWHEVAEFAGIFQITAIDFLTPEIGFVSATGTGVTADSAVVLQTNDGGDTWSTAAIQAPPMGGDGPINFPGGIFGCPTHPLATPPPGNPPAGLIEAAVQNIERTRGWTPVGKPIAYHVGVAHGTYSEIFNFQIPSCGTETVASSWVVELYGAPGSGGGGSTPQAQVVLAYSPDGWHVYGRYH